jgi:hypothetical protein
VEPVMKYCILLKNGTEIGIVTRTCAIEYGRNGKIKEIHRDDPDGFIQFLDVSQVVAVLKCPPPAETEANGNG